MCGVTSHHVPLFALMRSTGNILLCEAPLCLWYPFGISLDERRAEAMKMRLGTEGKVFLARNTKKAGEYATEKAPAVNLGENVPRFTASILGQGTKSNKKGRRANPSGLPPDVPASVLGGTPAIFQLSSYH